MGEEMKKECAKKDAEILAEMFSDYRQINLLIAFKKADYTNGDFTIGKEPIVEQFLAMKLIEKADEKYDLTLRGEKVFERMLEKGFILDSKKGYIALRPLDPQPVKKDFIRLK